MPHAGASSTSDLARMPPAGWRLAVLAGSRDRLRYRSPRERNPGTTGPTGPPARPDPHAAPPPTRTERIPSSSRLSPTFSLGETHVHNGFLRTGAGGPGSRDHRGREGQLRGAHAPLPGGDGASPAQPPPRRALVV